MRTRSPLSQPISNPSEHHRVGAIDGDPAVMPPFLARSGVAFEQQTVRLHHPIDPLHVYRRAAPLAALSPDQGWMRR